MAMANIQITASTPLSPLLTQPGMHRKLETEWDPYLIKKKHMLADRYNKSARWLPSLKTKKNTTRKKRLSSKANRSKLRTFRSGGTLFKKTFGSTARSIVKSHRLHYGQHLSKLKLSKTFLERTSEGPIRPAESLAVLKRVEAHRLQKKQIEQDAAVKIQSIYRDYRNTPHLDLDLPNKRFTGKAYSHPYSHSADGERRDDRKPRRLHKRSTSSKKKKKLRMDFESDSFVKETPAEKRRRERMEKFRAAQKAEKAAQRAARRELRQLELEADTAERKREEELAKLRLDLQGSTIYYHDLYTRTMHKVRAELVAAGHAAAAAKMQSVWRMARVRKQMATADAVEAMSEEDKALLEAVYGTQNILDVSVSKIESDLMEAREALTKIQATVRGRISRDEVALLRHKLRMDATGRSPKNATGSEDINHNDTFMLLAMYDDNASNTLDLEELKNFLADLDLPSSDGSIRDIMAKMDRDGDGHVDFQELIQTLPASIKDRLRVSGYLA